MTILSSVISLCFGSLVQTRLFVFSFIMNTPSCY